MIQNEKVVIMGEENTKVNINLSNAPLPKTPAVKIDPNKAVAASHEKIIDLLLLQWNLIQKKIMSVPVLKKLGEQVSLELSKIKFKKPEFSAWQQTLNKYPIFQKAIAQVEKTKNVLYAKLRAKTMQVFKIPVSDRTLKEIIQGEMERRTINMKNSFYQQRQVYKQKLDAFYEKKKAEINNKINKKS